MQCLPLPRVVGSPRYDSRTNGVGFFDYLRVDSIDLLPQIFRGSRSKAGDWIDVPRHLEHTRSDCREDAFDYSDDAMIEGVHCTRRFRFANASSDERLNVRRFDLDIDDDSAPNRSEHFRKGGNPHSVGERELFELRRRELGDRSVRRPLRMSGVRDRVVVYNHYAVFRRVHVELDTLGPELDSALKRGYRILGMSLVRTPVGDSLWRLALWTRDQAFLPVVALCSMSAKQ